MSGKCISPKCLNIRSGLVLNVIFHAVDFFGRESRVFFLDKCGLLNIRIHQCILKSIYGSCMEMSFSKKRTILITGVTARQLGHWASTGIVVPSIKSGIGRGNRREYSFKDLVQLKVAKKLRDEGISLQKVRKTVAYLRKNFPENISPLAEFRLLTNGKDLFRVTKDPAIVLDVLSGQFVWSLALGQLVETVRGEIEKLMPAKVEKIQVKGKEFSVRVTADPLRDRVVATCDEFTPAISCCGGTAGVAAAKLAYAIEEVELIEGNNSSAGPR